MTGLDFSPAALAEARALAARTGADVDFVESELYSAPTALAGAEFELVYTGIGALCWLPSIDRWAGVVAALLRPGGRLFIREAHPMLATLDSDRRDGLLSVTDPYFETEAGSVYDEPGTYVETDAVFEQTLTHEWNHGLGEVVTAILDHGLRLTELVEHDSAPWEALPGLMERGADGEWRLREPRERDRLPQTYTLQAVKVGAG
jgi:SAM-dependent methyltransferase